ncbi:MAG TPA: NADH-quinone oxidoreductase subunit NuoH [Phycisphaerae bacterium]|nr:NADH-quinone oxidoreductase subunit NuoH [Phycisphaerae bacterium]
MSDVRATDILKPRWDPALKGRAQRWLGALAVACAIVAVVGWFVASHVLHGSPVAVLLLCIAPAITAVLLAAGALAVTFAGPIGRVLPVLAAPIFFGGVVGLIVLVWVYGMATSFVDGLIATAAPAAPHGATAFGGPLTTQVILDALPHPVHCPVVSWLLWPLQFEIVRDVMGLVGVIGFVSLFAMFAIWWERKVAGRIQSRLGPMRVGGWHGWAQSLADGIKLIGKEDLIPEGADRPLFRLAPYLAFVPAICAFIALPFGTYWVFRNLDVGLIFVLAMVGVEVIGVILGGWSSNNKWSLYGAMREACQMVSYEIPMGMMLLIPIMTVGTLNLVQIGEEQRSGWPSWLAFRNPFLFVAFFGYFIASLASCKRAPFDLPEAESELVAGFMTEYSGFRWCLFFFAEYAAMFVVSALATTLFLGAWHSPLPAAWGERLAGGNWLAKGAYGLLFSGPLWFVFKSVFLIYVQMWVRWTLPRIRIDQVLYACVQVLLPLAMAALLGNTFWVLLVAPGSLLAVLANAILGLAGAALVLGFVVIMIYGRMNRRRLVGTLAIDHLPGA